MAGAHSGGMRPLWLSKDSLGSLAPWHSVASLQLPDLGFIHPACLSHTAGTTEAARGPGALALGSRYPILTVQLGDALQVAEMEATTWKWCVLKPVCLEYRCPASPDVVRRS